MFRRANAAPSPPDPSPLLLEHPNKSNTSRRLNTPRLLSACVIFSSILTFLADICNPTVRGYDLSNTLGHDNLHWNPPLACPQSGNYCRFMFNKHHDTTLESCAELKIIIVYVGILIPAKQNRNTHTKPRDVALNVTNTSPEVTHT